MRILLIWVGFSNRPFQSQPDINFQLVFSSCVDVNIYFKMFTCQHSISMHVCWVGHFCRKHTLLFSSSNIQVSWDINPIFKWSKIGSQHFTQRIPHPPAPHPGFWVRWDLPWPPSCLLSSLVAKINLPPRWANYRLDSPRFPRGHGRVVSKRALSPSTTLCATERERAKDNHSCFLYSSPPPFA